MLQKVLNVRRKEHLTAKTKQISEIIKKEYNDGLKKIARKWKKNKTSIGRKIGKPSGSIWEWIEHEYLNNIGIDHPYYYGGNYNGKAMLSFFGRQSD